MGSPVSGSWPSSRGCSVLASSALYNQNQLIVNVNTRVNPAISMFGYYVLNKAMSSSDGINTFPGNPYDYTGDYGRAATDVRTALSSNNYLAALGTTKGQMVSVDLTAGTPSYEISCSAKDPAVLNVHGPIDRADRCRPPLSDGRRTDRSRGR